MADIDTTYLDADTDKIKPARAALYEAVQRINSLSTATGAELVGIKSTLAQAIATTLALWHDASWVNVKTSYGAAADGVADDVAKIQAAATDCEGRTLYFPEGTYLISTRITLPSNIKIVGDGPLSLLKASTGDISGFYATGKTGISIQQMGVTAAAAGTTAYIGGVSLDSCSNCTIESVLFSGLSWAGVYLNNSNNNTVRNNKFSGWVGAVGDSGDIIVYRNSNYNTVEGNNCAGGGYFGVMVQDPYDGSTPTGNVIIGNQVGAHTAHGIAVYVTTQYDTGTIIAKNVVRDITGASISSTGNGIYVQSACGTVVTGNEVSNCCTATTNFGTLAPSGIGVTNITTGAPVIISNNTVTAMLKGAGIFANTCSTGLVISNNVVKISNTTTATNGHCIALTNVTRPSITGNSLIQGNANYYGIALIASAATIDGTGITGNTIKSSGYGIGFSPVSAGTFVRSSVSGNYVDSVDQALSIVSCTDTQVSANNLFSTTQYPLVVTNSPRTRITSTSMISNTAGKGPLISGTNTGSVMDETCYFNQIMSNAAGSGMTVAQYGSGVPTTGTWAVGDKIIRLSPGVGGTDYWRCVTAGTPGTWGAGAALS